MSVFADGVIIQRRFNDFDALAEAIPGWKLEAVSVAGGAFEAQLDMAMTAEMQLTRLKLNGGLLITGMSPEGAAGAGLHLLAPGGIRSRGRAIDVLSSATARLQQAEIHHLSNGPIDLVLIGVDAALFQRHIPTRLQTEAERFGADWLLRATPGAASLADRGHALNALLSALSSGGVTSREAKHRLQECALQILLDGLETDAAPEPGVSYGARLRVARAAEEVLRARLDDPPSLTELCHILKVPERTLHAAFHEGFGMAPKAYLRALRLSAAHRRLARCAGSVTEVATDLGFFHFGRFSGEYRGMFGECPSETLRRARGLGAS